MSARATIIRGGSIAAVMLMVAGVAACGVKSSPVGPAGTTYPLRYPTGENDDAILPASAVKLRKEVVMPPPEPKLARPRAVPTRHQPAPLQVAPPPPPPPQVGPPASTATPATHLFKPLPEWPAVGSAHPTAPPATETIVR